MTNMPMKERLRKLNEIFEEIKRDPVLRKDLETLREWRASGEEGA